jgi:hypothetical protein
MNVILFGFRTVEHRKIAQSSIAQSNIKHRTVEHRKIALSNSCKSNIFFTFAL